MYLTISDDVRNKINKDCKELNATPILISKQYKAEDKGCLYIVLAKRDVFEVDEDTCYVVWLYNDKIGGLGYGTYMLSFKDALEVMSTKIE